MVNLPVSVLNVWLNLDTAGRVPVLSDVPPNRPPCLPQVSQQMSGMTLNGAGGQMAFGQPPSAMGGWAGAAGSGQTLSTQLWK